MSDETLRETMSKVYRLTAVVIATMVVVLASCTTSTAPTPTSTTAPLRKAPPAIVVAVDTAATPRGWVPVDFFPAEVSVPATWWYDSPTVGWRPDHPIPGLVLVGEDHLPKTTCPHPAFAASFASVASAGPVEIAYHPLKPTLANGIPVYLQAGGLT